MKYSILTLVFALGLSGLRGEDLSYQIETIPFPEGVPPEVGGIDFTPGGKIVVALRRSDVLIADPVDFDWQLFASGLHNACGVDAVSDSEIVVSQMPELTRLVDTDGDGVADLHENVASSWGMSGNYHETNHCVPDGEGGYFVAVGTASHNGPVFEHVRGEYSRIGRRGRNFSAASWKGWVLHIDSSGRMTPWASGFRMHNGIALDSAGNLWSGDNQGDWKATTPFYHVEKGNFYGHVSSLVWDPEQESGADPLLLELDEIDALRTPAAILIPHTMNRSAAEPLEIPRDADFGPYGGQMLLPDNNGQRITRLMLEKVDGAYQGACAQFYDENGLGLGNNRLVFDPEGEHLYVGQTSRGWGQIAEGLQRISFRGEIPFDVQAMTLTSTGFRLEFTQDLPESENWESHFAFRRFRYEDTGAYGGDPLDVSDIAITSVKQGGKRTLEIDLAQLDAGGWVYEMTMSDLTSSTGAGQRTGLFCYTVNRLKSAE